MSPNDKGPEVASANALLGLDSQDAKCPICGSVFYRGPARYDFFTPIVALNEKEARKLVHRARSHCSVRHRDQFLWNVVVSSAQSDLPTAFEEQVDYLLHLALANGVRSHPLRRDEAESLETHRDLASLFLLRLAAGKQWFEWILPRRGKLRSQLVHERGRCASEEACNRLLLMIRQVLDFQKVKKDDPIRTEEQLVTFNRLQLLALEPGRYRRDCMFALGMHALTKSKPHANPAAVLTSMTPRVVTPSTIPASSAPLPAAFSLGPAEPDSFTTTKKSTMHFNVTSSEPHTTPAATLAPTPNTPANKTSVKLESQILQAVGEQKSNGSNRENPSPQYRKKPAAKSLLPRLPHSARNVAVATIKTGRPEPAPLKSPPPHSKKNAPKEKVVRMVKKKKKTRVKAPPPKGKGKGTMILDRASAEGAEKEKKKGEQVSHVGDVNDPKPPKVDSKYDDKYRTEWLQYYQRFDLRYVKTYLFGNCMPSDRRGLRPFVRSLYTLSRNTTSPYRFRQFLNKDYSWSFDASQARLSLMNSESREWESWFHLKPSGVDGVKGCGVYAARHFPKGAVIGFLCGRVVFRAAEKWTENPSDEYLSKYHPEVDVQTCYNAIDPEGYKIVILCEEGEVVSENDLYMGLQCLKNVPFDGMSNENEINAMVDEGNAVIALTTINPGQEILSGYVGDVQPVL